MWIRAGRPAWMASRQVFHARAGLPAREVPSQAALHWCEDEEAPVPVALLRTTLSTLLLILSRY